MDRNHLFVYGTLAKSHNNPMSRLLQANSSYLCNGWFTGRLYEIAGYPGALKVPGGYPVYGEIYRIGNSSILWGELDRYEETGEGFPLPWEYVRKKIIIKTKEKGSLECWIYLYNWDVTGKREIPGGVYRATS